MGENDSDSDKIVRALIYSFLVYVIYFAIKNRVSASNTPLDITKIFPLQLTDVILIFALSLIVGLLVATYKHHDLHRYLRLLKITSRTCRTTVWNDVFFNKANSYVSVEFKDGRRLYGWPEYYSDDPNSPFIFLSEAEWLIEENNETKSIPIPGHGILICPTEEISFIYFVGTAETTKEQNVNE